MAQLQRLVTAPRRLAQAAALRSMILLCHAEAASWRTAAAARATQQRRRRRRKRCHRRRRSLAKQRRRTKERCIRQANWHCYCVAAASGRRTVKPFVLPYQRLAAARSAARRPSGTRSTLAALDCASVLRVSAHGRPRSSPSLLLPLQSIMRRDAPTANVKREHRCAPFSAQANAIKGTESAACSRNGKSRPCNASLRLYRPAHTCFYCIAKVASSAALVVVVIALVSRWPRDVDNCSLEQPPRSRLSKGNRESAERGKILRRRRTRTTATLAAVFLVGCGGPDNSSAQQVSCALVSRRRLLSGSSGGGAANCVSRLQDHLLVSVLLVVRRTIRPPQLAPPPPRQIGQLVKISRVVGADPAALN